MNNEKLSLSDLIGARVAFGYTNWRGEKGQRVAIVKGFYWGTSPYHEGEQCFMQGWDTARKHELRDFALKDVRDLEYLGDNVIEPPKRGPREPFWIGSEPGKRKQCRDCGGRVGFNPMFNVISCEECSNEIKEWEPDAVQAIRRVQS